MLTVTVTYPTGYDRRELACHLDSAAHFTVYAADLRLPGGCEANLTFGRLIGAAYAGAAGSVIEASPEALARVAKACRSYASGLYAGCASTPILLTIAIGCEAALEAKAA